MAIRKRTGSALTVVLEAPRWVRKTGRMAMLEMSAIATPQKISTLKIQLRLICPA